ncbi:ras-related protein Rab-33B [Silurus meridionalis]|uniref:Ras-related protein Rab-33B n=1 Tax=Silurus meridionalis TaxID=175797 RepID=A0A8T0BSU4_SILME|nr:ras-related protein Rab-33B [Silurus meridionalis]KAF7710159.1 hypothetical protein HF521_009031 [Silurus meridionalis]KAI5107762.1 ras-related protein Rab-33B-like [Silurus meridionalis]
MDTCESWIVRRTCKIIVLGDAGVGKTSLTHLYCTGQFPEKTDSTIGVDFRERVVHVGGEKIKVQLWDTAGQERFRKCMVQHYYRNVHAVVFVYDVTNVSSFRSLPLWMEECQQHLIKLDVPRVLVANKTDLMTKTAATTIEQARHLAEVHSMPFYLYSTKNGNREQVDAIFNKLVQQICRQRGKEAEADKSFKLTPKEEEKKEKWSCNC